jgi:hypothetical protein
MRTASKETAKPRHATPEIPRIYIDISKTLTSLTLSSSHLIFELSPLQVWAVEVCPDLSHHGGGDNQVNLTLLHPAPHRPVASHLLWKGGRGGVIPVIYIYSYIFTFQA